jgi:hypothetical protein
MSSYSGPPWVFDMQGMSLSWLEKAKELKRAACLVWQGVQYDFNELRRVASRDYDPDRDNPPQYLPSVMGPFVLLAALAIENLLKGLLVIDHPEYVKHGKLRGEVITSHDLLRLAEEANIDLDEDEKVVSLDN